MTKKENLGKILITAMTMVLAILMFTIGAIPLVKHQTQFVRTVVPHEKEKYDMQSLHDLEVIGLDLKKFDSSLTFKLMTEDEKLSL